MDFKAFICTYFRMTAFFGWAALLLIVSVIPTDSLPAAGNDESSFRLDYLIHFGVFVVYAWLYGYWRLPWLVQKKRQELFLFLGSGTLYALTTELLQYFIESRTVNPLDMLLNLAGLYIGMTIFYLIFNKKSVSHD